MQIEQLKAAPTAIPSHLEIQAEKMGLAGAFRSAT
jgi:hypothetical protein